jgi:hypothetical protein
MSMSRENSIEFLCDVEFIVKRLFAVYTLPWKQYTILIYHSGWEPRWWLSFYALCFLLFSLYERFKEILTRHDIRNEYLFRLFVLATLWIKFLAGNWVYIYTLCVWYFAHLLSRFRDLLGHCVVWVSCSLNFVPRWHTRDVLFLSHAIIIIWMLWCCANI